jgi:hypothetical protein
LIKEALQYIIDLTKKNEVIDLHGQKYSTQPLKQILEPGADNIGITTLSGLVDYIKKVKEANLEYGPRIVHVVSPTEVQVLTETKKDMSRDELIRCVAALPSLTLNKYMDLESFNIMLQSSFVDEVGSEKVLKCAGNITVEEVRNFSDDGISQQVTGRVGINKLSDIPVPNPVVLKPFRTFIEVEQPFSRFIFRLHEGQKGLEAALFEGDGGAWRREAIITVKEWLEEALEGVPVVIMA